MKRIIILSITSLLFLTFMCAKKPAILSLTPVAPEITVKLGEKGIIVLKVEDTEGKIVKISGVEKDSSKFVFELNDKGELGDQTAKDGIWSTELVVPATTVIGKYNLVCQSFDNMGNPVVTKSESGEEVKISATIVLNVE